MISPFLQEATLAFPVIACPVLPKLFPCHVGAGGCRSHSLPDATSRQVPNFRVFAACAGLCSLRVFLDNIPGIMARRWQRSWPLTLNCCKLGFNTDVYTSQTESSIFAHGRCNDKLASQSWLLLESQFSV